MIKQVIHKFIINFFFHWLMQSRFINPECGLQFVILLCLSLSPQLKSSKKLVALVWDLQQSTSMKGKLNGLKTLCGGSCVKNNSEFEILTNETITNLRLKRIAELHCQPKNYQSTECCEGKCNKNTLFDHVAKNSTQVPL